MASRWWEGGAGGLGVEMHTQIRIHTHAYTHTHIHTHKHTHTQHTHIPKYEHVRIQEYVDTSAKWKEKVTISQTVLCLVTLYIRIENTGI